MILDSIDRNCKACGAQYTQEQGKPTEFCSRNCAERWFSDAVAQELASMGLPVNRRVR